MPEPAYSAAARLGTVAQSRPKSSRRSVSA
jgi:hypothetical protein